MAREIEMKFLVGDLEAARRAAVRAGGEYVGTVLQTDRYFDTPEHTLLSQDRGLRVRTSRRLEGPGGSALLRNRRMQSRPIAMGRLSEAPREAEEQTHDALVTYKGPRSAHSRAKSRLEIQTHVADPRAVEEILTELGLARRLVIQKRRSTYRLGRCLVELDELPILGAFVEIEGPSARAIEAVARRLGLEAEPIKAGYVHLAFEACPRVGNQCVEVTFRRCGARCRRNRQHV